MADACGVGLTEREGLQTGPSGCKHLAFSLFGFLAYPGTTQAGATVLLRHCEFDKPGLSPGWSLGQRNGVFMAHPWEARPGWALNRA